MSESLGKAVLDLEANLAPFEKSMKSGKGTADDMQHALDALAAVANAAESALNDVRMKPSQGAESKATAESILSGVRGIGEEARQAARDLDDVKLDSANAAETTASGDIIDRKLKDIVGNANEARRSLESVRLAAAGAGGAGGGTASAAGSSGGGGLGLLGAAIGGGALLAPAAGPAVLGLLGAIPVLAASGAGALGTLALAFDGVFKAIGGDKKAFDDLGESAQGFVQTVRSLDGWFDKLKETAAGSLFPGLTSGLKSALSPGTLNAITQAVTEFGHAIGAVAQQAGQYFGSAEFRSLFGPLMAAGAANLRVMGDTMMRLTDAIGVLGRAAIPFTEWMVKGIDAGARWFDAFMHAKAATGALGGALNEAETSLRLVGNLAAALGRAIFSLGEALYPVSKIAVKDLTDGLNALSVIFRQSQGVIREVISTALTGLVTALKVVTDGIRLMIEGWQHVLGDKAGIVLAFTAIGAAILLAMGPTSGAIVGAILAIGLIKRHWDEIAAYIRIAADNVALGILEPFSHLPGALGEWARKAKDAINSQLADAHSTLSQIGTANGNAYGQAFANAATMSASRAVVNQQGDTAPAGYKPGSYGTQPSTRTNPGGFTPEMSKIPGASYTQDQIRKLLMANGVPADVATNLALISAHGEDPSGSPYALNDNAKTGDYSVGLFQENFLGQMGVNRVKSYAPQFGLSPNTPVKQFVAWLGKHPSAQAQIAYQIYQSQGYGAWTTAAGLGITGGGSNTSNPFGSDPAWTKNLPKKPPGPPTGAALLPESLRNALQKAKDKATTTQGATAAVWLHTELDDLDKARQNLEQQLKGSSGKKKKAIEDELRNIDGQIASVNRQITTNLHSQAQAVKSAFSAPISAAKSDISSAFSTLKQALDTQFQAATQTYIDTVLGPKFFQGTDAHGVGLQTPLEKQLADMQSADQLKSLQDAVSGATDPAAKAAAQRQLDEYQLSIKATAERAQADYDYAQAVKKYQAERTEAERQLDLQLDMFGRGLLDGSSKMSDLSGIIGGFGLSLIDSGGIVDSFDTLGVTVGALVTIMLKEAQRLAALGDKKDAAGIQTIIDATGALSKGGGLTSGLGGATGFFLLNQLPKLDTGGHVEQTGLAVVHRGEDWSGVGANRRAGAGVTLTVGPVYGAIDQATARLWATTLKTELDRVIQL